MYVYIKSDFALWTVGFYDPNGTWIPESDHDNNVKAAERVAYLNGGKNLDKIEKRLETIESEVKLLYEVFPVED